MSMHPWRTAAITTAFAAALATGLTTLSVPAAPAATGATTHQRLPKAPALSVDFDGQDATVLRGARFTVSGTVESAAGDGVPADLTLAVTDATGTVLGTQDVTAASDGTFSTSVPGTVSKGLPAGAQQLGVRALDVTYDGRTVADGGAQAVEIAPAATGLRSRTASCRRSAG